MAEIEKEAEIQWVKYGSAVRTNILGKDVIVLNKGNFISFIEATRPDKRELIYHANNEVRGDGIQCLCTHRSLQSFAFAERCRNPRVLIMSYPSFEVLKSFESQTDTNYVALRFSEMEFLVALTAIPDYKIVIWNCRTGEKPYTQKSELNAPLQILRVSLTSPIQIVQAAFTTRQAIFWDLNLCYKKTVVNRSAILLPESSQPPYSFAFGTDGDMYFVDSEGSLYSISSETRICTLQIPWSGDKDFANIPCLTYYKGGFVFSGPGEVQFWKRKSPEGWAKVWALPCKTPFKNILSSPVRDLLVGISQWNDIVVIKGDTQVECTTVRSFGSNFEFMCFVHPVGDFFVTFGNVNKNFTVWNKKTGLKTCQIYWAKGKINALACNPKWPYLVAVTEDGEVYIINVYDPYLIMILEDIPLTKCSLDAVRFQQDGTHFCVASMDVGEFFLLKLPAKTEVIAYVRVDLKIVDYGIIDNSVNGISLLIVPMSQLCCRAGQTILLYVLDEKQKTFEYVKDINMPSVVTSILPSPVSLKELFCVPHRSRSFYAMNILNGKMIREYVSGHQMKFFGIRIAADHLLTFGIDGIVIAKLQETKKCKTVFATHHRLNRGIKNMIVDPYMQYVITQGNLESIICVSIKNSDRSGRRADNEALLASPAYKQIFLSPLITEKARLKALEKLSQQEKESRKESVSVPDTERVEKKRIWLELRELEKISWEEQHSKKEKQSILDEFQVIKQQLKKLLNENEANVLEKQLPVQAFDLDKVGRRKKLEDGKLEREKEKQLQTASIKHLQRISDIIKKVCWEIVDVKGRELHGILINLAVQNYALMPEPRRTWLHERLNMEHFFHKGDFFEPWVPRTDSALKLHVQNKFQVSSLQETPQVMKTKIEEEQLDEDKVKKDIEEEAQRYVWTGTSTHNFVEVDPRHYSQFELTTFLQSHQEIQLIEIEIRKLMLWFNKEFAETYTLKQREMEFVCERNNQFRHIINELNFFNFSPHICKTQIYDPEWAPEEDPETILRVDDWEVKVPMYISESRMEELRKQEAERERLRLFFLSDDFKEKALIAMMDGVLEKLWEDEIKKEVPKPKCMIEKEPENYNEDDLKAIRAYEEAVRHLGMERERYRKILEAKWVKNIVAVKDGTSKFDEKVIKLHLLKLKVESAIGQEVLKCLRIRQRCFQRIDMDRREDSIKARLVKNEKKIESMTLELNKLNEMLNDCKNYYENLQNKDKNLDKNFKREFPDLSPIVCEQLYKLSKKRPKLLQRAAAFSSVLCDMGKFAVAGTKPEYLPLECMQYLKDLDALDVYSNSPASVSQQSWELACKLRRVKIESELKIRACAIDLADAETTVSNYQKALKAAKEQQTQLQNEQQALRSEKLNSSVNYQIQLVLKRGLVEIPLSGDISDFEECILVTKDTLLEVNRIINKTGQQKLKAMQKAANFRKGIIFKEWEHKKLRMEIEDLKSELDTIEKMQVLKELQAILVARARGFSDEKGFLYLENELTKVKQKFEKAQIEIFDKIDNLNLKIEKINRENQELDERIAELHIQVNEMNLGRDLDFDKKNLAENVRRMKKVRERSKLVRTIQEQHNEILVLQTELELLRLKTYPTIKYKVS